VNSYRTPDVDPLLELAPRQPLQIEAAATRQTLAQALDEISEIDRRWFEDHPERTMYLRHPHATEHLEDWHPDLTIICQVTPGYRLRLPFKSDAGAAPYRRYPQAVTEVACRRLWEEIMKDYPDHPAVLLMQAHVDGTVPSS
jgi:hypothetical protein